ncbi:methyl-accepting chemotaxis protein [Brevibacillus sp. SYSU BS000544]|uniref:methyl-accepting chemotaxis protein n=1 Tax=Brevibacillus sp. SYSU BS000544 TaxID=3416443 RepID=UPI003CE5801A
MKLTLKLIISYVSIVLIIMGLGLYATFAISSVNENGVHMYDSQLVPVTRLAEISKMAENTRVNMLTAILFKDKAAVDKAEQNLTRIDALNKGYSSLDIPPAEKEILDSYLKNWNEFSGIVTNNIRLVRSDQFEEAAAGVKKGKAPFTLASEDLTKLIALKTQEAKKVLETNNQSFDLTRMVLLLIIGLSGIVAITIGVIVGKVITTPIRKIAHQASEIASGDLTGSTIDIKSKDELGELAQSFNSMVSSLNQIVTNVRNATDELAETSQEMAASTQEVTSAVEEIAKSTQQVARESENGSQAILDASTVLLELSSLIQIAKGKATSAASSSAHTLDTASEGKEVVQHTIHLMDNIKDKTKETEQLMNTLQQYTQEIGSITDTITQIAQQTNLLALNAAIEAARAGEAGKGFAVVADEVRKLAEQSNEGAHQVADILSKIQNSTANASQATKETGKAVDEGMGVVNKAGDALQKILIAVKDTVTDVEGIVAVTDEEVASSERIVSLINSIATIIENMAANAEEVSASTQQTSASMDTINTGAEITNDMALNLKNVVERFKT